MVFVVFGGITKSNQREKGFIYDAIIPLHVEVVTKPCDDINYFDSNRYMYKTSEFALQMNYTIDEFMTSPICAGPDLLNNLT